MEIDRILSQKEVLEQGMCFDGDSICYGGKFGQQVCQVLNNGEEKPVTGLIYEVYRNGNLNYYRWYIDGISNGAYVCFYENGDVTSVTNMYKGTQHGSYMEWYENGKQRAEGFYKYGFCEKYKEWSSDGIVTKELVEPSEFDKAMIEKYEHLEKG